MEKKISKRKIIAIVVVAVLVAIAACAVILAIVANSRLNAIPAMSSDEVLAYTLDDCDDGVISIGILSCGKKSFRVYGKDGKVLPSEQHTYEVGSVTKTVTASLVCKAVWEGKLNVDDGLNDVLTNIPECKVYPTFRQLLTHTSGYKSTYIGKSVIKAHFTKNNDYCGVSRQDVIGFIDRYNAKKVGKYNYSNFGYALLGLAVEKLYGDDYTQVVNDYVQTQLGMPNTHISVCDGDLGNYWQWEKNDAYLSAGGLTSNIQDMLTYAEIQLGQADFWKTAHTELAEADCNTERNVKLGIRVDAVAYGWCIDKQRDVIWHNGATSNYNCYVGFSVKNQTAVVVLSNLSPNYKIPATVLGVKLLDELSA